LNVWKYEIHAEKEPIYMYNNYNGNGQNIEFKIHISDSSTTILPDLPPVIHSGKALVSFNNGVGNGVFIPSF